PIILEKTGYKYYIEKNAAKNLNLTLSSPQVLTLQLKKFQSGLQSDFSNHKLRLVIPVDTLPPLDIFDFKSLKINDSVKVSGLIETTVNKSDYHLFIHKNDDTDQKFIFIDSLKKTNLNTFKEACKAIITAVGYICGNLYLGEYYYQTIKEESENITLTEHTYYEELEESAITNHALFDPFQFNQYYKPIQEKNNLKEVPYSISKLSFSTLCNKILTNGSFSRCCRFIIEGNQSKQLLLRAGILSIALETMTTIIYEENKEKINPIEDKSLAKVIRERFQSVVNEYSQFITDYGQTILSAKIADINKPTNSKKLSKPFEILGIKLSKEDISILNHRNKFLHGTSPVSENEEIELRLIISRIELMLNRLILKYIGYSGHIINYYAWIQKNSKREITDHPFKII
ncbi:MAG: hypothetical protein ACI8ZO_001698, partial [Flavobacteriales bacterium]